LWTLNLQNLVSGRLYFSVNLSINIIASITISVNTTTGNDDNNIYSVTTVITTNSVIVISNNIGKSS
jgi:hypothetical protein